MLWEAFWIERAEQGAERVILAEQYQRVVERLSLLDRREADVIRMRYGLGSSPPMTLNQIGAHLDLTRERVRQLQAKAWLV